MTMLRLDVITLFAQYFEPLREHGVCRRALQSGQVALRCWDPRDFTHDRHRSVDDRPYGGGPGMVMLYQPLKLALQAIRQVQAEPIAPDVADVADVANAPAPASPAQPDIRPVILLSPCGAPLTQARVQRLADSNGAILVCGRYEGVDQRFIERFVDEQLSLGDFVLSGGEVAALALLDATLRLLPGVLHDPLSSVQESFATGLLDHPHYSRPELVDGLAVPEVLLGGNHQEIERWRRRQALLLTQRHRPDLLAGLSLSPEERRWLEQH